MDQDCLRALYDQAPLCIHAIGADGRLVAMNPVGLVQVGADSADAVRGRPYLDFVSPQDRVRCLMAEAFAGQPAEFEFDAPGPAPARRLVSGFIPVADSEGRIVRLVGITRDRSQRRQAEQELNR